MKSTLVFSAQAIALLSSFSHAAHAQEPTGTIQRVEVSGAASANVRRDDTAARIVVGRDEIVQYGDTSLSAVLKRQPGVSLTGGEIRMRGLGAGYTQLLVNGDPVAAGFSIDSIAPAMIERIDILRTATAELGSQAIAGTINVILKKGNTRNQRDVKLGAGLLPGRSDPSASLQWGEHAGDLAYSLAAEMTRTTSDNSYMTLETLDDADAAPLARRELREWASFRSTRLNLTPRVNWTLSDGASLAWQTFINVSRNANHGNAVETTVSGASTEFPINDYGTRARTVSARSDISLARQVGTDGKLTVKAGLNHNQRESDFLFRGTGNGSALARKVLSDAVDNGAVLSGKYLAPLMPGHAMGLGWEGGRTGRTESRRQNDSTAAGQFLSQLDEDYRALVSHLAVFAQDEWSVSPRLQAYLGLRWEGLHTSTEGRALAQVSSKSSVLSPVTQLLWKLDGKDQLRFSLSRIYKAPAVRSMVPRRYMVNNANGPTNPDVRGNPALKPELAWGVDMAYESYFGKNGVASVSAYARRIDAVTVQTLYQENGAWISTPFNNGKAKVAGLEFDARFALRNVLPAAPDMDLRANAARNWSRLDAVPGPDNRLGDQARITANIGFDGRIGALYTVGMNLNLQFGGATQMSRYLRSDTGPVRVLDVYGVWKAGANTQWRLSVANALHRDRRSASAYADGDGSNTRAGRASSAALVRLVLETSL
ncbi:TonB-dependent receptor plug domain-containing protein [Massilia antarctica]|uniref:TonB-dependent receptor plug domain-containing protein n=1 Tax=Massilia antarctica TaxID=2765360 RepID=UPI0006BB924B|nr:TonB-dependent receptor [Massilia sp. H27-R4]MCY0914983.1 TonB-dependent receptor [Massilia sp. H27-R4]CUI06951.1 TonB-dependent receptor [Janthinobacterium sp. CG23_2]CUU30737.1 TonB-dependent receptor [Janthinobacterium sp. CG23_2]